jgi:hypothetical protein
VIVGDAMMVRNHTAGMAGQMIDLLPTVKDNSKAPPRYDQRNNMKAILLTRTGDPSVLDYVEVPTPRPCDDEVLVKADTIGVSRPEILVRKGTYQWMPKLPAIPGIEMSGIVVERGRNVTELAVGQKVLVSARELPERAGCYAEYLAVPARAPFRLPDDVDLEAAACLSNYQVAYHIIHTAGRVVPGGTAVIDSAAGGTGSALVQLARIAGMRVIAIAGGPEKAEALRKFGADDVIDHVNENPAARVAAITAGAGADLVLDGRRQRLRRKMSHGRRVRTDRVLRQAAGLARGEPGREPGRQAFRGEPGGAFLHHAHPGRQAVAEGGVDELSDRQAPGRRDPAAHPRPLASLGGAQGARDDGSTRRDRKVIIEAVD